MRKFAGLSISITILAGLTLAQSVAPPKSLEERRFDFDRGKAEEDRRASFFATIVSVALAVAGYIAQGYFKRKDESSQRRASQAGELAAFKLKAAEIAMASRDTSQVKGKLKLLAALFPKTLDGVTATADDNKKLPYFGHTHETREFLLELLMKYPDCRADIIRAWAIMFPWDDQQGWNAMSEDQKKEYKWFKELKADQTLNANRPSAAISKLS